MKHILPTIIGETQAGFIKGHSIHEHIAQALLVELQKKWSDDIARTLDTCKNELSDVSAHLADMLKAKVCMSWMRDGDRNTKFYHAIIKSRRMASKVQLLTAKLTFRMSTLISVITLSRLTISVSTELIQLAMVPLLLCLAPCRMAVIVIGLISLNLFGALSLLIVKACRTGVVMITGRTMIFRLMTPILLVAMLGVSISSIFVMTLDK